MILKIELSAEEYAYAAEAANHSRETLSEWAKGWIVEAANTCDGTLQEYADARFNN